MKHLASYRDREREQHRALLGAAERALRGILHSHLLEPKLRAHAERAIAHVAESQVALDDPEGARTVEVLGEHLGKVNRFLRQLPSSSLRP
ncbi:MAG: hypothetical protein JNL97_08655 [Verrucomicrobiales bacterium]|nr:hypothetical protein [Verrucomicrobiales bacterium]